MAMAVVALILLGAGAAEAAVISGTVYTDEGVTSAGAGLTVRLIVNGVDNGTDVTDAAGAYSIVASLAAGDAMLVYVDGDSIDATTVTVSDGADLSGFDIYADHVIARQDNGGSLTNADMDTAKGTFVDDEIEYSISAGALTVPDPNELYVPTGYTFAPGTDVTAYAVEILGTVNGGADTFTVQADWLASSGSFNAGTSSVEFTADDATFTAGPSSYYDVTINLNNNRTVTLGSSLDVDHDLTITKETLDVSTSNYAITVGGNFTNLDTFTARNGTVTLDGTGQSILGSTTFYNLTKSVAAAETLTFQAGQTTTINGTVTLNGAAANLLSLRSDSPGSQWIFNVTAGAIKAIDYVDVQDSDASGSDPSQLAIEPTNSVESDNNIRWFDKFISGTVYTDEGITNAGAGLTVRLIVNGVDSGTDVTDAGGAYSIVTTLSAGDAILVYVDGFDGIDATTVTVSDGADLAGFDIYADHVITRHDNGGTLSNADMDTAKGGQTDNEIEYSVTAGALSVPNSNELYVPAGYTFAPGADVTTYAIEILGTVNGGADTFTVEADWLAASGTFNAGTSSVDFTADGATFTAGPSSYYDVTINLDNNRTLTLGSSLDVDHDLTITKEELDVSTSNYAITVGGNFTNLDTFTARNGTVTLDGTGQSILGSTTFYNLTKSVAAAETLTFQAGQTTTINGTVTLNGAAANLLSLRSDSPGTRWNFNVSAGATKAIDYVDVQDSDASGSDPSQLPITPTNSVDSSNNVFWFAKIISGTVYTDEGITNAGAGITVRLIVNGVDVGSDVTDATGAYSIVADFSAGDAMLVYVDGDSIDATTVTVSDGADLSGFDIYADHVITRQDNGGSLTNADMDTAKGTFIDDEIEYSVTAGALSVPNSNELYVPAGYTFAPGADVTTYAIEILGTVNGGADTFTVEADWLAASGTFNAGTSSVEFTADDATFTAGPSSYYDVTINLDNNRTLTLGSSLDVDHDLTITKETLDVSTSNYAITVGGNFSNFDIFTARSGTVTLDGTGQSILGSTTFYNLTKSVAAADTLTFQAGQTTTINGTVTLSGVAGNLLSLRSDTPGTRWIFTVTAGAVKAIDYVDVQDSDAGGSDASQLPILPTNSVDSGNNIDWFMPIISGTVYTDEGVTNAGAGLTVRIIADGVDVGSDVTDASGAYSITASVHHEDAVLIYVDAGAIDGTTVTVLGEGDLSGFDIYADHVITRHDNGGALSNADMDTAKGSYVDDEIEYSVAGGVLTVSSPNELYVPTGHTFFPDEDVTTYDVEILGTFNLNNDDISVERDWVAGSGTIAGPKGSGHVFFISGSATFVPGPSAYPKVTVSLDAGSTLTLGGALDVDNNLRIDSGTLDASASSYAISVGGNFSNFDTFTARSGTVTFDGTDQSILGSTTFYNLTKSVAAAETLTFQAGQTTTINGTVTLNGAAGNLLSLRSDSPGSQWIFNVTAGATKAIDYVDVQDSDAGGSDASQLPIGPTNFVDSGNTIDWFPLSPAILVTKTVTTLEDPINGITNPKAIPGAIVLYTVQLTNFGTGPADADSLIISDLFPTPDLYLRVVDYDGGNPGPVAFVDGSPSSGLNYTFISLGSSTDDVEFSNDGGSTWTYTPVDSGDSTDPAVTNIRVNPKAIFAGSSGAGDPNFQVQFKAVVQ